MLQYYEENYCRQLSERIFKMSCTILKCQSKMIINTMPHAPRVAWPEYTTWCQKCKFEAVQFFLIFVLPRLCNVSCVYPLDYEYVRTTLNWISAALSIVFHFCEWILLTPATAICLQLLPLCENGAKHKKPH